MTQNRGLLPFLLLLLPLSLFSQKSYKFWVEFRDKNNSPYCICRPWEFLSAPALERRAKAGIPVEENDLPVNPAYLEQLKAAGVRIHTASRWMNAAAIISDSVGAAKVGQLPFVRSVQYLGPHLKFRNPPNRAQKMRTPLKSDPAIPGDQVPFWGYAAQQNSLLGIPLLHAVGQRGEGIRIVVMDGGFINADTIPLFDSVALQGRLWQGWDFVERDGAVYEAAQHGTSVLSVMASNLPHYFVGGAPDATYYLLKTEDTGGEYPIEEVNWIAGAEWADSIGADIINASLGYTSFNDPRLSHSFKELDGRTAIGSRGAGIAATKGMIICNAAGNEGDGPWHYLGVPADAPGIVAVGAVNSERAHATFSSYGPSADGRIKPDLMAPGDEVVTAGNVGIDLGLSSGTSLASPMLAGGLAALWSAFPEKTAKEILDAVYHNADQAQQPDNTRGYGLPDLGGAWLELSGFMEGQDELFHYDRRCGTLDIPFIKDRFKADGSLELRDIFGKSYRVKAFRIASHEVSILHAEGLEAIPPGYYQVVQRSGAPAKRLGIAIP